jgi:hypothetical protein
MMEERHMFQDLELNPGGRVGFGGKQKERIIDKGTIGNNYLPSINFFLFDEGLMHNLLSINQLSDIGYDIIFNQKSWKAVSQKDGYVLVKGKRKTTFTKLNFQI